VIVGSVERPLTQLRLSSLSVGSFLEKVVDNPPLPLRERAGVRGRRLSPFVLDAGGELSS